MRAESDAEVDTEFDRLLDAARAHLGAGDDARVREANLRINEALCLRPEAVDAWLVKCQIASAAGDDIAALAAAEMATRRAPHRAEAQYWRGAILGDLGRPREALRAIEAAIYAVTAEDHWILEDLYYEKALILAALGLHDAAVATCEAGLARCPASALLRSALAPVRRARVRGALQVIQGGER